MFEDRAEAGRQLAHALADHAGEPDVVVMGIPRGGVIVAAEVARALRLPLGVAVAAKIGAPGNPEYAIGAVAADGVVGVNPAAGFSPEEVSAFAGPARAKVARETQRLRAEFDLPDHAGKTVLLVDDGLATGLTARVTADWLRRTGAARVIVAVPVAPPDTVTMMCEHADDVVVLDVPAWFGAVGEFYRRFGQTSDEDVAAALSASRVAPDEGETR